MPSKLSIHLSAYPNRAFDILQKMQPGVVKVFNFSSEINIDEIRRRCPNAIIVYRQYTNQDYHGPADAFFKELGDTMEKLHGRGILWEGVNEPIVKSIDDAKALNAWYVRFAQLLHGQGELVAGFSWSTGNPSSELRNTIIPYLTEAAAAVDVHAFHEYYSLAGGQIDWGAYRLFEQSLPQNARKPVVITETGLDDNGNPYTGGWRGKKTPQQYLDLLKAYDALLMQDPYVLGATVFQWGDYSWPSFDLDSMIDLYASFAASAGCGVVIPKPWPVPSSPPSQPTYSFTATPATIVAGASATLVWTTQGVGSVSLNGQPVSASGSQIVMPVQTTTYTLHLVLPQASTKDLTTTVTVQPAPPPQSASFSATPTTITAGGSASLQWVAEGASAVTLNGQTVAARGSQTVTPAQTTTYTLHVVFADKSTKDLTAPVTVQPAPPPQSASFSATPTTIAAGGSALLQWVTEGASAVTLNGQTVAAHGSQTVTPAQTTTFSLHVVFVDNSTKDLSATVTVQPAPPVQTASFSVNPSTVAAGGSATLTWATQGTNSVLLNGQPVAASGNQAVKHIQTTTHTLHVAFADGSTRDLSATVTVQAAAQNASFSATPTTIAAGDQPSLNWSTQGASAVTLNGQPVAASGSEVVTPVQTTTYLLHVTFADGSSRDLTTTVTVSAAQPIVPTRPPTVVITPENVAHLKTFPRPAQDNGRGLHFNLDLRDPSIATTVANLLSIHCKWTLIYVQDELQTGRAAKACWDAGIMPVIRIGKKVDENFDPVPYVNALKKIGVPPYLQIYNEPGDTREWNHYPTDNLNGIFGANWKAKALAVLQAGGFPGIQCLDRSEFKAAVDALGANHPLWQKAFFVLHNYGANHPPAYPYDPRNQQDHPGQTILDDNVAALAFLDVARWMMDHIGFVLPIVGGEGGWEYQADQDNRYPRVEQPYHARYHTVAFDWFRSGVLSNGEPLPDYLFSITPWIEGGWGADDWWGGSLGDKTLTTNAVAAIPPFVRKFSWDGAVPLTPAVSFTATPTSIAVGTSSTLEWHVDGASDITLNGAAVAEHGTSRVSPVQTTTYTLHVVYANGATQDLSAKVTVTMPPPPPDVQWDPHLDTLGVRLNQSTAAHAWRLKIAAYQDPGQTNQNHHVYFQALRADGSNAAGVKFVVDWVGRDPGDQPAYVTTDASGQATCPLWASFDPNTQIGIYFATTPVDPGDTASNLGLPNGRHVNFLLTFQYS